MAIVTEKKKPAKRTHVLRIVVLVLLVIGLLLMLLERNLESVILDMAYNRARAMAVVNINEAISDIMRGEGLYEQMITVRTDSAGRVTMIQANAVRMNELATQTAMRAQEKMQSVDAQSVSIPLGAALGVPFLAALGPRVQVHVVPVGAVTAAFTTEFESAGINQTRHKIYLSLHTTVNLVVPTGAKQVNLDSQVLIAESIIVGIVPDTYVEVPEPVGSISFLP